VGIDYGRFGADGMGRPIAPPMPSGVFTSHHININDESFSTSTSFLVARDIICDPMTDLMAKLLSPLTKFNEHDTTSYTWHGETRCNAPARTRETCVAITAMIGETRIAAYTNTAHKLWRR